MTVYLDTSSIVKLYIREAGTDAVSALVRQAPIVSTSRVAYAESRAAFARLRREGALTSKAFAEVKGDFDSQWPAYLVVEVTDSLSRAAGTYAERYGLRGFDSVHLASFAEVARRAGVRDTVFSSFDDRLNTAARRMVQSLQRGGGES